MTKVQKYAVKKEGKKNGFGCNISSPYWCRRTQWNGRSEISFIKDHYTRYVPTIYLILAVFGAIYILEDKVYRWIAFISTLERRYRNKRQRGVSDMKLRRG